MHGRGRRFDSCQLHNILERLYYVRRICSLRCISTYILKFNAFSCWYLCGGSTRFYNVIRIFRRRISNQEYCNDILCVVGYTKVWNGLSDIRTNDYILLVLYSCGRSLCYSTLHGKERTKTSTRYANLKVWYKVSARDNTIFPPEGKVIQFSIWADSDERFWELMKEKNNTEVKIIKKTKEYA